MRNGNRRVTPGTSGGTAQMKKMRFEFYSDAIAAEPKLSVDGTVDNAIHFSHWKGNETPDGSKNLWRERHAPRFQFARSSVQ